MYRLITALLIGLSLAACDQQQQKADAGKTATEDKAVQTFSAEGKEGKITVKLCDDETTTQVEADKAKTREDGQHIANELMAQWKRKHPDANWVEKETEKHKVARPADNSELIGKGQGSTYGRITEQDVKKWERETYKMAVRGSEIFHSPDEMGSEIAVSCDMCHPDAANTHPETYPKFQVQLGRVALLRDMINWCIEHPVRGEPLEPNSAKMRALEAYIIAQRKGEEMIYGKR